MRITFKNFVFAADAEKRLVLEWRNSARVRTRMIDQSVIPLDGHMRWMDGLRGRNDCAYYLVYDDEAPAGVVDFTSIDRDKGEAHWGFYLASGNRPGFGVIGCLALDHCFGTLGFSVLRSQVLRSNLKSRDWHLRLSFTEERQADGRDLPFRFRLEKEVWLVGRDAIKRELFKRHEPDDVIWIS